MDAAIEVDVTYAARRPWAPRRAQFASWVIAALSQYAPSRVSLKSGRAVVSIRIVGSARSRTLNARYRRKDRATNVLSFAGPGPVPDGGDFLGELVICAPIVAREARKQCKSAEAHWAHMTVHGVLHLLGFDHERTAEARKMEAKEVQILDRLGVFEPVSLIEYP